MGCVVSSAHQRFRKRNSIKRLRESARYADELKARNLPREIPKKCPMLVMKEMRKELRSLTPEAEFDGRREMMNADSYLDGNYNAVTTMTTEKTDELVVWRRQ